MPQRLLPTLLLLPVLAFADGAADNKIESVRRIPPPGVPVPDDVRTALTKETQRLGEAIGQANLEGSRKADVIIFHKAVDWALRFDEFFNANQFAVAEELLKEGFVRLEALKAGKAPWREAKGLVVQGYWSKIDGSVQPYGLVIPEAGRTAGALHVWFHGRGEVLSELDFLAQRLHSKGEFAPEDATVLHTYGRYCNGQRFAGETDFWEALEDCQHEMGSTPNRPLVVRGFSLGGAACWHIGTHHAAKWAVVNPGAGFSETEQFLNFFQGETLQPHWFERKLWNLYDSTTYAANLSNTRTLAYSGEIDRQKQAADVMQVAMQKENVPLTYIVGPKTAHAYEAAAKVEIGRIISEWQNQPKPAEPASLKFVTYTLKYDSADWVRVLGLEQHWEEARVEATRQADGSYVVTTKNVTELQLTMPFAKKGIILDGQKLADATGPLNKNQGQWIPPTNLQQILLRKKHNLQGPIDDAFMDAFLFVRPTGKFASDKVAAWIKAEMERAESQWRRQFRGVAPIKDDTAVTDDDMKTKNLILWGDPASNSLIAKFLPDLPLQWTAQDLKLGSTSVSSAGHLPILIYPTPHQSNTYVVLNSGFTFREYDQLNNARQTPKLPDWAVIDLDTPPTSREPGRIIAADFFDEFWKVKPVATPP